MIIKKISNLQDVIFKEFGLDLKLTPFGDNIARNNVFLGENSKESFIVKIDNDEQIK